MHCRNAKSSQEVVDFVQLRLSTKRGDDQTLSELLKHICEEVIKVPNFDLNMSAYFAHFIV